MIYMYIVPMYMIHHSYTHLHPHMVKWWI